MIPPLISHLLADQLGSTPGSCPCPLGSPVLSSMSENSESDSLEEMAAAAVTVTDDEGGAAGTTEEAAGSNKGSSSEST